MAKKVKINNLTDAIMAELKNYSDEVHEEVVKATKEVAKDTVDELRATSPKRYGVYAKSWSHKQSVKGNKLYKDVVYNKDHYRLTHLLENGHAKVNGGRVAARVHIKPAEEKAIKALEEIIVKNIKRG